MTSLATTPLPPEDKEVGVVQGQSLGQSLVDSQSRDVPLHRAKRLSTPCTVHSRREKAAGSELTEEATTVQHDGNRHAYVDERASRGSDVALPPHDGGGPAWRDGAAESHAGRALHTRVVRRAAGRARA